MGIKVKSFLEAFPKYCHKKLSHFPLLLADYEIQMLGRWKSACYKTYVRSPLNVLLQFPQRIAKTASITYQYANPYYQNTQDSLWTVSFSLRFSYRKLYH